MRNSGSQQILTAQTIDLHPPRFSGKDELFRYMAGMLRRGGYVDDEAQFIRALYEREAAGSTYMGDGIAMPHGKSACVRQAMAAFCRCSPFRYVSQEDDEEVTLVVMLAVPERNAGNGYLRMLANLSRLMLNDRFLNSLKTAREPDAIVEVFAEELEILP